MKFLHHKIHCRRRSGQGVRNAKSLTERTHWHPPLHWGRRESTYRTNGSDISPNTRRVHTVFYNDLVAYLDGQVTSDVHWRSESALRPKSVAHTQLLWQLPPWLNTREDVLGT